MITYILNAVGLDPTLVSSDFGLFASLLLICISVFGITKVIFILFQNLFGGY